MYPDLLTSVAINTPQIIDHEELHESFESREGENSHEVLQAHVLP
jgi:hypothetical protein